MFISNDSYGTQTYNIHNSTIATNKQVLEDLGQQLQPIRAICFSPWLARGIVLRAWCNASIMSPRSHKSDPIKILYHTKLFKLIYLTYPMFLQNEIESPTFNLFSSIS